MGARAEAPAAVAAPPPPSSDALTDAVVQGHAFGELRFRDEFVHSDAFAYDANADTLRTILGYQTGVYDDIKLTGSLLNVSQYGDHAYNDGADRQTHYPAIGDPGVTELYLTNLDYSGLPDTDVIVGRQALSLDDLRFVGAANWRQIPQTFDAATVENRSLPDTELFYSYVFFLNRSPGTEVTNGTYAMSTHLLHAAWTGLPWLRLVGYTYLADIMNVPHSSSATTGVRGEIKQALGETWRLAFNLDAARQAGYGDNPDSYALAYYLVEPGAGWRNLNGKLGYEVLQGNGVDAVQTPLMAPHPQNGWADQFTVIPPNGLRDFYAAFTYKPQLALPVLQPTELTAAWHDYNADRGGLHYGSEFDADITQPVADHYSLGLQFADYRADGYLADTRKLILTLDAKF